METLKSKLITYVIVAIYIFIYLWGEGYIDLSEINPNDYARITDVEYTATLIDEPESHGKIRVKERLTFDVHAASKNNGFWELWRDLPEQVIDGVKTDYTVLSVNQILSDGTKVPYGQSDKLYWDDYDYVSSRYGPGKWYHSEGPYSEARRRYECVFFYINDVYREEMVFEIEYEMTNAALKYNDCSELYLTFYSEETIKYLETFKASILIPNNKMPRQGNYSITTFGTTKSNFPFLESTTLNPGYHTIYTSLDKSKLKFTPDNEYLELTLVSFGTDKHSFTEYASINDYTYTNVLEEIIEEQNDYKETYINANRVKAILFISSIFASYLIVESILKLDQKAKSKNAYYEPEIQMDYFREIPSNLDPSFAADLAFIKNTKKKDNEDVFAAILLSLVRKRYVELEKIDPHHEWVSNNVKIHIKYRPNAVMDTVEDFIGEYDGYESLTPTEEYYFNLLVRHAIGSEISMNSLQAKVSYDYENTNTFLSNIERSTVTIGVSQGYFQKADYDEPKRKMISTAKTYRNIGLILLILGNLISYFTCLDLAYGAYTIAGIALLFASYKISKNAHKYILLTQFGEDEYAKWYGLYKFLDSETLMNERTVIELPIWEQYLVYATAFGISEKVINALEIRCPEIKTMADSNSMLYNPYYRSRSFYVSNRSFRRSVRSTSHSVRSGSYGGYSSGFGGHGGYGGGGRGGGGGGGGH